MCGMRLSRWTLAWWQASCCWALLVRQTSKGCAGLAISHVAHLPADEHWASRQILTCFSKSKATPPAQISCQRCILCIAKSVSHAQVPKGLRAAIAPDGLLVCSRAGFLFAPLQYFNNLDWSHPSASLLPGQQHSAARRSFAEEKGNYAILQPEHWTCPHCRC